MSSYVIHHIQSISYHIIVIVYHIRIRTRIPILYAFIYLYIIALSRYLCVCVSVMYIMYMVSYYQNHVSYRSYTMYSTYTSIYIHMGVVQNYVHILYLIIRSKIMSPSQPGSSHRALPRSAILALHWRGDTGVLVDLHLLSGRHPQVMWLLLEF